jgi:hypothetical protein
MSNDWGGLNVQRKPAGRKQLSHQSSKKKGKDEPGFTYQHGRSRGETSWTLSGVHHYKPPFEAQLVYYYHEAAIRADAEMNEHIIEHWKARGVDWNHGD